MHSKLRCPIKNQSHINPNGSQWLRHFNPLRLEGDLHLLSHQASFIHCLAVEGLRHRMRDVGLIFLTSVLLEAELKLAQISSNSSNSRSLHVSVRASGRPRIPTSSGMSLTFSSPTNPRIPGDNFFLGFAQGHRELVGIHHPSLGQDLLSWQKHLKHTPTVTYQCIDCIVMYDIDLTLGIAGTNMRNKCSGISMYSQTQASRLDDEAVCALNGHP